jgi:predicted RNA-binding Zn-ribbon protein involved in translation (DUF1610 family)
VPLRTESVIGDLTIRTFRTSDARMPDKDRRFISGYHCPACGETAIGINQPTPNRQNSGWNFRVVITEDMEIACTKCGADVPREHWTFAKRR